MSKRRKYDGRNKRSFVIILILAIIIVGVFSFFIYKYSKASKIEYVIESGSVLQDVQKNYINIDDDGILKIRWNDDYYLKYNDKKYELGDRVISYNTLTGGMKLYGDFYEIASDGKIIELKDETVLPNTTNCKFYKLDDRKYLLIDTKIVSDDYSIETNSYLLVELDKAGNAKLSNNKVNLKTISPVKLVTSEYTFDIANEILSYKDLEIDLKKIIGSTNQYVPEDDGSGKEDDKEGTNDNEFDNNIGIGTGTQGGAGGVINNTDIGNTTPEEDIMDKVKMTSVIRIIEGITQIDIDYVIYDPYNEYKSVYVEVSSKAKRETIHLSKTDTHLTLSGLTANTEYKLKFVYTTDEENQETGALDSVVNIFEEFDLKTKMPEYSITVHKISNIEQNILTCKVNLQEDFKIKMVNVNLSFDHFVHDIETGDKIVDTASLDESFEVKNNNIKYILGNFIIDNYNIEPDTLLKLTVKSVVTEDDLELPVNSGYTFRYGR